MIFSENRFLPSDQVRGQAFSGSSASAPLPKFVIHRGTLSHELRKQRGTSKHMILVPLFDLKFL